MRGWRWLAAAGSVASTTAFADPVVVAPSQGPDAGPVVNPTSAPAGSRPSQKWLYGPEASGPVSLFLERHRIFQMAPWPGRSGERPTLLFEAELAPHLVVYESLGRALHAADGGWHRAQSFSVTMVARLRMIDPDASSPVRMPSYMPRVQWQGFWVRTPRLVSTLGERDRPRTFAMLGVSVALAHHSNGQDGCTWNADLRAIDPACRVPTQGFAMALNRTSGDFSTNYLWVALRAVYGRLHATGTTAEHVVSGSVEGEVHPQGMGPGGLEAALAPLYGRGRLRLVGDYLWERPTGRLRAQAGVTVALGATAEVTPYRLWMEAAWTFNRLGGFGVFARLHLGHDDYNAYFVDRLDTLQFGVVWDRSPPISFRSRGGLDAS